MTAFNPDALFHLADTRVMYMSHGGGPLPVLGDPGHGEMVDLLAALGSVITKPSAIVLISAHWEESVPTLTGQAEPPLLYDYYGFPPESYSIQYPAPGNPALAQSIRDAMAAAGIASALTLERGFDHGLFIPLKLLYPGADIPCVQLSLLSSLDPEAHIKLGAALRFLPRENILVIGSGFSFHNMSAFFESPPDRADSLNDQFHQWLGDTVTGDALAESERRRRLIQWEDAPAARFCHPREEHLLPLHVCFGAGGGRAKHKLELTILNKRTHFYFW